MSQMIVPMLLNRIRDHLTSVMVDGVAASDPTQADRVKVGRFQENPKDSNIWLAVSGGDPDDPDFLDGLVTLDDHDEIGFWVPIREIGGGEAWWRRGTVHLGCFFVKEGLDEETVMSHSYVIYGRLQQALREIDVADLIDDYGERAMMTFLVGGTFFESGGPKTKYYWRGKVRWQVLTNKA